MGIDVLAFALLRLTSPLTRADGSCYNLPMDTNTDVLPSRLFTVSEYHRMAQAGVFGEDERVELLDGQVVAMSPIEPRHALTVDVADCDENVTADIQEFVNSVGRLRSGRKLKRYDSLSEICHPNSYGHHRLFGERDRNANVISYSDTRDARMHFSAVFAGTASVLFVEGCMDNFDKAVLHVAEIQHRIAPVGIA